MGRGYSDPSRQTTPLGSSPIHISDYFGENRRLARKGWHVALRESRESIEKNGIDYKVVGSGSLAAFSDNVDMFGRRPRKGNYIFLHQEDAESTAKAGIHDIWEVDIPEERQHLFHHDRGLGPNYSGMSPRKIPTKYLTRITPEGPPNPEELEKFQKSIDYIRRTLNGNQFGQD